jgi:hypothetical protein
MTKTKWLILIAVLVLGGAACSTRPNNPDPSVPRRTNECTDPRFKAAELEAYRALLQAYEDAAKVLEQEIDRIQAIYRRDINKYNDDYQSALKGCKDSACSLAAKAEYDKWTVKAGDWRDDSLYIAQGKEQQAKEAAQQAYHDAVNEAKEKFCPKSYRASGSQAEATYEGIICSLAEPFVVNVTSPYYEFTIQLTPSNTLIGLFTYSGTWYEVGGMEGDGAYSVTYNDNTATGLILNVAHTTHTIVGDVSGGPVYNFNLTPLETDECSQ